MGLAILRSPSFRVAVRLLAHAIHNGGTVIRNTWLAAMSIWSLLLHAVGLSPVHLRLCTPHRYDPPCLTSSFYYPPSTLPSALLNTLWWVRGTFFLQTGRRPAHCLEINPHEAWGAPCGSIMEKAYMKYTASDIPWISDYCPSLRLITIARDNGSRAIDRRWISPRFCRCNFRTALSTLHILICANGKNEHPFNVHDSS